MTFLARGWLAWAGVGLAALILRAALLPVLPIPAPSVHDEFSYLLGADTFRLGRLTNPPHPMWVHFETFHVNFLPSYASKYPPAQAAAMAFGWKLLGHPWFGVWLSMAAMCAALCWMLQGWLPPRYALLGGLMAVAQWGVVGYWINSYWGGAVAAAAGAVVVGAVPRLARRPSAGATTAAACAMVVLANSRPYEGGLTVVAAIAALFYLRRSFLPWRVILPAAAILACGLAAMAWYNYRVTGDPLLLPYALNERTYGASPLFWMQSPHPSPPYRHEVIRRFWEDWDKPIFRNAHAMPATVVLVFLLKVAPFYLTPLTGIAVFAAIFLRRSRKVRLALVMLVVPIGGLLLERYSQEHYLSPATGLVVLLIVLGIQYFGVRFGKRAVPIFALVFFAVAGWHIAEAIRHPVFTFGEYRQQVLDRLESQSGNHLVIVRYAANHKVLDEWVYNRADIDGARVVWARDMGDSANRELLDYYRGRQVWLLEPDGPDPVPHAY